LTIFAVNSNNSVNAEKAKIRVYSCQIYDNGTLIRNYIPVLYYGTPCLYDKVNKKYYYNAGTDEFLFG
jgi:hypothetical protein